VAGTNGEIRHPGVVEKIDGKRITVRILPQQACSACHSKASCGISGDEEKFIEVQTPFGSTVLPGEQVLVSLKLESGFKALLLGYIFPLILLVAVLFALYYLSGSEGLAALSSLITLILYYGLLYAFRGKLQRKFTFGLEKSGGD